MGGRLVEPRKYLTYLTILTSCSIMLLQKLLQLIYEKLPSDIASRNVLLLDPVLASGITKLNYIQHTYTHMVLVRVRINGYDVA